jgi:hypothetical protein
MWAIYEAYFTSIKDVGGQFPPEIDFVTFWRDIYVCIPKSGSLQLCPIKQQNKVRKV